MDFARDLQLGPYQEIEWTSPGTYNWVVPEGVNAILVTTVGGGGGYGYFRHIGKDGAKYYLFNGGSGGEVTVNKLIKTTPGETLQIIVGKGGANVTSAGGGEFNDSDVISLSGKCGGDGGMSYLARNGTMIDATKARGGAGGVGQWYYKSYSCHYSSSGKCDIWNHWYHTVLQRNTATVTTKYMGGTTYYGVNWGTHNPASGEPRQNGTNGYSGYGGKSNFVTNTGHNNNYNFYYRAGGNYRNMGGGGSWGDGAGNGVNAGIGGGGAHYSYYAQYPSGNGMVHILAIGLNYD